MCKPAVNDLDAFLRAFEFMDKDTIGHTLRIIGFTELGEFPQIAEQSCRLLKPLRNRALLPPRKRGDAGGIVALDRSLKFSLGDTGDTDAGVKLPS